MSKLKLEDRLLYSMAHLQEYYDSKELLGFFKECEEKKIDICGGFLWVEMAMKDSIYGSGKIPEFVDLKNELYKVAVKS